MDKEINVLALVKGEERFIFLFDDENRDETLRQLARFAANPELDFSWYDAAMLSRKIRDAVPTDDDYLVNDEFDSLVHRRLSITMVGFVRSAIAQFLKYLANERNASDLTIKAYREDLFGLVEWLEATRGERAGTGCSVAAGLTDLSSGLAGSWVRAGLRLLANSPRCAAFIDSRCGRELPPAIPPSRYEIRDSKGNCHTSCPTMKSVVCCWPHRPVTSPGCAIARFWKRSTPRVCVSVNWLPCETATSIASNRSCGCGARAARNASVRWGRMLSKRSMLTPANACGLRKRSHSGGPHPYLSTASAGS